MLDGVSVARLASASGAKRRHLFSVALGVKSYFPAPYTGGGKFTRSPLPSASGACQAQVFLQLCDGPFITEH
jgi:hypothetical protein